MSNAATGKNGLALALALAMTATPCAAMAETAIESEGTPIVAPSSEEEGTADQDDTSDLLPELIDDTPDVTDADADKDKDGKSSPEQQQEEASLATCGCYVQVGEYLDLEYRVKDLADNYKNYSLWYGPKGGELSLHELMGNDENVFTLASYAPDHMGDEIHVVLKHRGADGKETVVKEEDCSVKSYLGSVIADPGVAGDLQEEAVELCKAALDYGSATQLETGFKKDDLPNGGKFFYDPAKVEIPASESKWEGSCEGICGFSSRLDAGRDITLVAMFKHEPGAKLDDYDFWVDGEFKDDVVDTGEFFEVRCWGIFPGDIGEDHSFVVERDGQTLEVTTSPLAYMSAATQAGVVPNYNRALYTYHQKAKAYVDKRGIGLIG